MKRAMILAGSIGLAVTLAGCFNTSGSFGTLETAVRTTLTKADNALARLAANEIPAACGIIDVAKGYFRELEPRISAKNVAIERQAEAVVDSICSNPPANTAQAFGTLFKAWMAIQKATKAS